MRGSLTKRQMCSMADYFSELVFLIEKINVLTEEIYITLHSKFDLESERGRYVAEHNLKIASIKSDMTRKFVCESARKVKELLDLSEETRKNPEFQSQQK